MPRVLLIRLLIFTLPFMVWFAWREIARRRGRAMGSTPWSWLVAFGAALAAGSLIGSVLMHSGSGQGTYVPAETGANGAVTPGRFTGPPAAGRSKP